MKSLFEKNLCYEMQFIDFTRIPDLPQTWYFRLQSQKMKLGPHKGKILIRSLEGTNLYSIFIYNEKNETTFSNSHMKPSELDKMFPDGWQHLILSTAPLVGYSG